MQGSVKTDSTDRQHKTDSTDRQHKTDSSSTESIECGLLVGFSADFRHDTNISSQEEIFVIGLEITLLRQTNRRAGRGWSPELKGGVGKS